MNRRWVSLGGWCGPSLMLSKLGLRGDFPPLPYDMVRCTMDGMTLFNSNGFDGYFPPATEPVDPQMASRAVSEPPSGAHFFVNTSDPSGLRMRMDPSSIWLLFRGQHTAFTHFDLNMPPVRTELQRRIDEWHRFTELARRGAHPPVTFLRTCLATNPADELRSMGSFMKSLDDVTGGRLDYRVVLALHNQGPVTELLGAAGDPDRCVVWNLAFKPNSEGQSLFDRAHDGYEQIVTECGDDGRFAALVQRGRGSVPQRRADGAAWTPRDHLAKVEGIPAFRGTCTGFGSTVSEAMGGVCMHCGDATGHGVGDVLDEAQRKSWSMDDDGDLVTRIAIGGGGRDLVATVEALSQQLDRPAVDVLSRMQELVRRGDL